MEYGLLPVSYNGGTSILNRAINKKGHNPTSLRLSSLIFRGTIRLRSFRLAPFSSYNSSLQMSQTECEKGPKHMVDTNPNLKTLPPSYILPLARSPLLVSTGSIPTIDLSGLYGPVETRLSTVKAISSACVEWGFFRITNHGIEMSLMEEMLNVVNEFFNLSWEEKMKYASEDVMNPVRYGTSLNASKKHALHWRDYLRHHGHPIHNTFHLWPNDPPAYRPLDCIREKGRCNLGCERQESHGNSKRFQIPMPLPNPKPSSLRFPNFLDFYGLLNASKENVAKKYLEEVWKLALNIAGAISQGLGLERRYIEESLGKGCQIVACNYYPACPEPDRTLGLAAHSDHGGLTILMQNEVDGLQVKHNEDWVAVDNVPGTFVVNVGDYLEILSNGRYKSVEHRAVVNEERMRISVAVGQGPELTAILAPASPLVDEKSKRNYRPITYKDYMKLQQSSTIRGKSPLQSIMIDTKSRPSI